MLVLAQDPSHLVLLDHCHHVLDGLELHLSQRQQHQERELVLVHAHTLDGHLRHTHRSTRTATLEPMTTRGQICGKASPGRCKTVQAQTNSQLLQAVHPGVLLLNICCSHLNTLGLEHDLGRLVFAHRTQPTVTLAITLAAGKSRPAAASAVGL